MSIDSQRKLHQWLDSAWCSHPLALHVIDEAAATLYDYITSLRPYITSLRPQTTSLQPYIIRPPPPATTIEALQPLQPVRPACSPS